MAESKKLEDLVKDQLVCAICLDQYTDPRTLSCLHSFCVECLGSLNQNDDGSRSCPSCRVAIQGDVHDLPKAFLINNLLEIQNFHQKALSGQGNKETVCDNCTKNAAKLYCRECDKFICHACNDVHKRWSSLSSHMVMGIEEVSEKAIKMVSAKPPLVMDCPNHNEPLKVYCVTCEQPICYLCTIKDHKGHDHNLVTDVYEESKQNIRRRLESLEEKIKLRQETSKELERSKQVAQEKADKHKQTINKLCDQFVARIENVRTYGLQAVEMGLVSYLACEDQRMKEEDVELEALYSCKEHVERSLEISTPTQLLVTKKQLMARFDELVGEQLHITSDKEDSEDYGWQKPWVAIKEQKEGQVSRLKKQLEDISDEDHDSEKDKQGYYDSIKDLQNEILSLVPLSYPEVAYKKCQFQAVGDFPNKEVYTHSSSSGLFTLLYEGHSMLISKDIISCYFADVVSESSDEESKYRYSKINCTVDYYVDNNSLNHYQLRFTTGQTPGNFSLFIKIGSVTVDTGIKLTVTALPNLYKILKKHQMKQMKKQQRKE